MIKCRTLAAWQEVSRVVLFLEIRLQFKGIVLEVFGCRIYSCVLRPSVISLVSDAESPLHFLASISASIDLCSVSVTMITSGLPQVPVLGSDTLSKVLAQNKQRSQSCTQM